MERDNSGDYSSHPSGRQPAGADAPTTLRGKPLRGSSPNGRHGDVQGLFLQVLPFFNRERRFLGFPLPVPWISKLVLQHLQACAVPTVFQNPLRHGGKERDKKGAGQTYMSRFASVVAVDTSRAYCPNERMLTVKKALHEPLTNDTRYSRARHTDFHHIASQDSHTI